MAKTLTRWKIVAKNNAVLGIFQATSQLEAWQKCCAELGIQDGIKVSSLEPGITFITVDDRDWKPTHVITRGLVRKIEVRAEKADGYPNLLLLYTREEWINHEMNHWDLLDGTKLRHNGKSSTDSIEEKP